MRPLAGQDRVPLSSTPLADGPATRAFFGSPSSPLPSAPQCIDFASTAWCRLFCRLRGGELLLEALLLHVEAMEQGQRQAEAAALAALQALHSLVRSAGWERGGGWAQAKRVCTSSDACNACRTMWLQCC